MENKDNIEGKDFTPKQIGAIRRSIQMGRQLQEDIPEIADDYRRGMVLKEIVRKYDITSIYNISGKVAMNSVHYAIVGHEGGFNVQHYEGLITDESELERLCSEHNVEGGKIGGKKGGKITYERGLGIHGRTAEQMSEDRSKGGKIGGKKYMSED